MDIANGRLITGGGIGDVRVWSLAEETSEAPAPLRIHEDTILSMVLDGERLFVSDADGHLIAWDLAADPPEPEVLARASDVWHVALSPDRTTLATIDETGEIALWNVAAREPTRTVIGKHDGVFMGFGQYLAFNDDGRRLLAGGGAGDISVWDLGSGAPVAAAADLPGILLPRYRRDAMLAIAGERLALVPAARPATALLLDAGNFDRLREVEAGGDGDIAYVTFADGGEVIALAHGDGFATAVDAVTGTASCTARLADRSLDTVSTDRSGSVLAGFHGDLGLDESEIHVARCDAGQSGGAPVTLSSDSQRPTAIALSTDGWTLFSGHQDGSVFAWRLDGPRPVATRGRCFGKFRRIHLVTQSLAVQVAAYLDSRVEQYGQ